MTPADHAPIPEAGALDACAVALAAGGLVVLPTDTVYGLAARAADPAATATIFERKGRTDDVPIAVLCADPAQALALAADVPDWARALAEEHWPGPLTLVLPRRHGLGWHLGRPTATIGLRCPDRDLVRALAGRIGPLATTSANRHGVPTPATAAAAAASLLGPVAVVVDGGTLAGAPSTVLDATGDRPVVLRSGSIVLDDLR